jgi:hypothetical protein
MTGKKIKIALCLSGEPRSSMASFPYIYETFLRNNPIYQTDVYIHSLKGFRSLKSYQPKNFLIENDTNISLQRLNISSELDLHIDKLYPLNNSPQFTPYSNTLVNQYLMLQSINKCFNLIQETYDIYIRSRYDIIYTSNFHIEHILLDIVNKKYDIFIPHQYPNFRVKNEYNDQLAIGNLKSMTLYSDMISNIPQLVKSTESLNVQSWLKYYLDINNIKVNQSYLDYRLIRQCNITTNDESYNFLDQ